MSDEKPSTVTFYERTFRNGLLGLQDLATEDGSQRGKTITVLVSQIESVYDIVRWSENWHYFRFRTKTGQDHKAWAPEADDLAILHETIVRGMK